MKKKVLAMGISAMTLTLGMGVAKAGEMAHAVQDMSVVVVNQDECVNQAVDGAIELYDAGLLDGHDIHEAIDVLYDVCRDGQI